jgi:uroporphyrinogen decarboxylase
MDSRERVIRTLEFNKPDRIPIDLWMLPSAIDKYGERLEKILTENETDIVQIAGPCDVSYDREIYEIGKFIDVWQCEWTNCQGGIVGEVKNPPLKDLYDIYKYNVPTKLFYEEWEKNLPSLEKKVISARNKGKFIIGGWINPFERMQFLRGTEELLCDLYFLGDATFALRDKVTNFYIGYLDKWLEMDVDAIAIGDDWGSQISLLISPELWRKFFKPVYKELCDTIIDNGKYVFFHSDGYIFDIYQDLIDLGVKAINSQLWCIGVEKIAAKFAGEITFWGELSRQSTLPTGYPSVIRKSVDIMKKYLYVNNGGLIGQSEIGKDVPLENIEMAIKSWNLECTEYE